MLAQARTLDDVATVVVVDMVAALGARTGALAGRAPSGDALVILRQSGFPAHVEAGVHVQPLELRSPLTECFRTQTPVWIESRDGPDGLDARYPRFSEVWNALGVTAAAFVPLVVAGEAVGVISFSFEVARSFSASERSFFLTLGQQAALALERARLFAAEREARAEAEAANRAKSQFLTVMSHELRTPLNAIGGYAELLALGVRGPVTEAQQHDLDRLRRANRHLIGLISDVLSFARIEGGQLEYHTEEFEFGTIVADVEALVAPQVAAKSRPSR
jgi:signal transduction histidine kinase